MKPTKAEAELATFLESQPSWLRKCLQLDLSFTREEGLAWANSGHQYLQEREKYERLLQRVPHKWREYRELLKRQALARLPQARPGAPRKDALAGEAAELLACGKSYAQIAIVLNEQHGPETTTKEAIRKLLNSRQQSKVPRRK